MFEPTVSGRYELTAQTLFAIGLAVFLPNPD